MTDLRSLRRGALLRSCVTGTVAPVTTDLETASDTPAAASDTYSALEAARVLKVSERRARQLAEAGVLRAVNAEGPLRVRQSDVHDERARRREATEAARRTVHADSAGGRPDSGARPPSAPVDIEAIVSSAIRSLLPLALAPAERAEEAARTLLMEERAGRLAAEMRAAVAEERLRAVEERLLARQEVTPAAASVDDVEDGGQGDGLPRRRGWWRR